MTQPHPATALHFYLSHGYACGYLPNKAAMSLIAAPHHSIDAKMYDTLIQQGFRRSGQFIYKPHCAHCQACVPVRIVLKDFEPNRSQKRAHKQHQNLSTRILTAHFNQAHYEFYARYQKARHAKDVGQQEAQPELDDAEQYRHFLCLSQVETVLVEFSENNQLKMVSVIDLLADGISAVYTFYDPDDTKASYGTYNVLWQIAWAKSLQLPYLYLGYWIKDSQKMAYKQNFHPLEKRINSEWRQD